MKKLMEKIIIILAGVIGFGVALAFAYEGLNLPFESIDASTYLISAATGLIGSLIGLWSLYFLKKNYLISLGFLFVAIVLVLTADYKYFSIVGLFMFAGASIIAYKNISLRDIKVAELKDETTMSIVENEDLNIDDSKERLNAIEEIEVKAVIEEGEEDGSIKESEKKEMEDNKELLKEKDSSEILG